MFQDEASSTVQKIARDHQKSLATQPFRKQLLLENSIYPNLLLQFYDIKPPLEQISPSSIMYLIIGTTRPPDHVEARPLVPDRLQTTKAQFQQLLGHLRPSKSNYNSSLLLVPRKDAPDWRSVDNYLALNARAIKDTYIDSNILDFSVELNGIFPHTDLKPVIRSLYTQTMFTRIL